MCKGLDVTLAELLDGEEREPNSIRVYDEEQVKSLLGRIQKMEKNYKNAMGVIMIIIRFLSQVFVSLFGGSHFQDFVSGLLFGLGLSLIAVGIIAIIMNFKKGR